MPRLAALCPRCSVLAGREKAPELLVSRGRLSWAGYCVEASDAGFIARLRLDTPNDVVYHGIEPGRRWTRRGATFLFAGPPVLAAFVLAIVLNGLGMPPLVPVVFFLVLGVLAALFVAIRWRLEPDPFDRALDHGWARLAPLLHRTGYQAEDDAFLGALAKVSVGRGRADVRGPALQRSIAISERAVATGEATTRALAALWRLAVADADAAGLDPVPFTAAPLARAVDGAWPLAFAEQLLAGWKTSFWTDSNLARLRVLLCEQAFAAGVDVHMLIDCGGHAPALGDLLRIDHPGNLAGLRLIWNLRATRPWDRCGPAFTVFELAVHPRLGASHLDEVPDLLLFQEGPPAPIAVCSRGVRLDDTLINALPRTIDVEERSKGFRLLVDDKPFRFPEDPDELARRLQRWCGWFFGDFRPQTVTLLGRRAEVNGQSRTCPQCGQSFRRLAPAGPREAGTVP